MIISVGKSRKATEWAPKDYTWRALADKMSAPVHTDESVEAFQAMTRDQKAEAKDVGGFVGGELSGSRGADAVVNRCLVALDADYGGTDLIDNWELLLGAKGLVHSTHSHTPEHPRLRFILPLSRPVTPEEYEPVARFVAYMLDSSMEAFDDTTYEANRLMFWPSIPSDGEYVFVEFDGEMVDPDEVLAQYPDWRDRRYWYHSTRQEKLVHKMADKAGDPLTKPGVVGAFNRAYKISEAIAKYLPDVYTPCGKDRWTYVGGTTQAGAVVYDDDTFLYSHHDTDPVSRRLCNAFDLVRYHLFGLMDAGDEEDLSSTPSQAEMRRLCASDERVREELASAIVLDPEEAFTPQHGEKLQTFDGDFTEQGAANDFCSAYGAILRYNGALGWLFWDGCRWITGADPEAGMLFMRWTDELYGYARVAVAQDPTNKQAQRYLSYVSRLRSTSGRRAVLAAAQDILYDGETDTYDSKAWELNTPSGIVDLQTGEVRGCDKASKHTKVTGVSLSPDDPASPASRKWASFIDHLTGGDIAFAAYLQELAGMAAVGEVYEEGLVVSYGQGGNGKSTLWGALRRVMGDYAKGINADVLVATNGRTDQSYVVALRGARLAIMGETEEGAKFGVAQMKRLTSRDTISARALYKDPIEFTPTHTTVMHTNHLPKLKSLDGGTLRRMTVAVFPSTLPPERVITNYERVLADECGGAILRWIVEGAMRFWRVGCKLEKPECVARATREYLEREDWLQQFIDDNLIEDEKGVASSAQVYQLYARWCDEQGEKYVRSRNEFARSLEMKGYRKDRRRVGGGKAINYWFGLSLPDEGAGAGFDEL